MASPVNSRTSRLLPMPAGPNTTTSRSDPVSTASSSASARLRRSRSRPTIGDCRRPVAASGSRRGPRTGHALTGWDLPRSSRSRESPKPYKSDTAAWVRSPTRMVAGSAACSSLAATFTASPTTIISPSGPPTGAMTLPELTPIRAWSVTPKRSLNPTFRPSSVESISRAAPTARRGSSSWAIGTPKTAMIASPMYFSTVPPQRSMTPAIAAK